MFEDNTFEASASAFPTGQGKLEKVGESAKLRGKLVKSGELHIGG